uniref:Uncharacterized protein n=1 Tax=Arundo donax TaxID=35708 RepID=A0A0A8YBD6_ARUDO
MLRKRGSQRTAWIDYSFTDKVNAYT